MITIIFLVLAISLDALSFGLAQGFNKNKIGLINSLMMTIFSTILFAIPLYLSTFVSKYLSAQICYNINGSVLIVLGLIYLVQFVITSQKNEKLEPRTSQSKLKLSYCLISTIPISLDAIFTAFLSGYSLQYIIFAICLYFVITFLAIYFGNKLSLNMTGKLKLNVQWLSGSMFILLGILKILGI